MVEIEKASKRILVVEDDGIIAARLESILTRLGYRVLGIVAFGEDVLARVGQSPPDLVLMDVYLAGEVDGIEAAAQVRAAYDIPVVYLTAFADDALLQQAKITEPYGYLVKPVRDKELHATIEMALYRHKLESRLKEHERWLDTTLHSIGDAVIATDEGGRVTFMNPIAEDLTGWVQAEAIGHDLSEIFHIVNATTRELVENPVTRVLQEGGIVGLANHTVLVARDGTEIPIDDNAAPIRDDKGSITGVVLVFRDVTERAQMEQALQESEERYRTYIENAPDGIFIVDSDARYLDVNEAACRMTDYSRNELLNMSIIELAPPDAPPEAFAPFEELQRTGEAHGEIVIQRKHGSILHTSIDAVALSGGRYMAFCSDITERVRAESERDAMLLALRESEEQYRTLVSTSPDAIAMSDLQGNMLYVSPQTATLYGLESADELVGQNVLDFVSPEDKERGAMGFQAILTEGVLRGLILTHPRKDGSKFSGETNATLIRGDDGEPKAIIALTRDVTRRVQAEETRRELMHALGERVKELNCLYGISRLIERPGIALEELLQGAVDLIPPALQYPANACARVILQGQEFKTQGFKETPYKRSSDIVVHGEPSGSVEVVYLEKKPPGDEGPFLDQERNLLDAIAKRVGRISERAQVEAQRDALVAELEAKNAELERFTYTISHDLKSPLITIQGFLGLLLQDVASGDAERIQTDVDFISSAVNKMNQLLNELLELSRIGRVVNPPEEVQMGTLVREAVGMVAGHLNERAVQVEIAHDLLRSDDATVLGDRTRLREMVENLVVNAAKYMGDQPNPRVEIGLRHDGDETVFFVRDNGIGIDPRYHDRVFVLFEKLDTRTDGVGVGLAIVKRIIEVHGGRVWVESKGEGHGSAFCFTLAGE